MKDLLATSLHNIKGNTLQAKHPLLSLTLWLGLILSISACSQNNTELENDLAPEARSSDGTTALHWAVYNNDETLVKQLIASGANVNAKNNYDSTPLSEAAVNGNAIILQSLLEAGADVDATNAEGQTALMVLARSNNIAGASTLIEHGANVNQIEQWRQQSAIIWAAAQAQPEMVALLISHGADVNARSQVNEWDRQITAESRFMWRPLGGFTALIYAARENCLACAQHLIEAGADIDQTDAENSSALLIAILNLNFDVAKYLIEAGANVSKWDLWGNQPLYAAIDMNTLPAGGHPDRPSVDDTSAQQVIDLLLANGANPNAQLKLMTLQRSIKDDRGADPILDIGATPLLRAAKAFDVSVIDSLLAYNTHPNLGNLQGITPLMAVAGLGSTTVDTRGNYSDPDIQQQVIASLALLLAAGGELNAVDNQGHSALHGAAFWGWNDVVGYLVSKGADKSLRSNAGFTPEDVAMGKTVMGFGRGATTANNLETAELLRNL